MSLSLKPSHLKRYKDLARLLLRYGQGDLVRTAGFEEAFLDEELAEAEVEGDPKQLADDLEQLGPTFIKLGQMLSTRPDLLPAPYLDALARLQDRVAPFSFEEIEQIVSDELGVRLSKAFETFEATPLAAASLGQVHRAHLRNGRAVVVKVQRPGIRQQVLEDLEALDEIASFVDAHTDVGRRFAFQDVLHAFRKTLLRELDYRREAQHLVTLGQNMHRYDLLVVPQPVDDYTTTRVLTMDYVAGTKITALSALARLEFDGAALADTLSKAYLDQVLVDGFFHADPHPGNVFIVRPNPEEDGPTRLALIDLGMVAHVDLEMQEELLKLLLAVSEGQGHEVAERSVKISTCLEDYDAAHFRREVTDLVTAFQHMTLEEIQVGRILLEIARLSGACGIRPPPELTLLGKTLLNLDEVGRTLDPTFNPNEVIRAHATSIMQRRMLRQLSPGNVFSSALEMNELVQKLPARLNTLLDALVNREFELRIRTLDEVRLLHNLHSIANRLSISLVLAALIIGAALMMRVQTTFTIFGYPGLAMLLFLGAAACGFVLILSILFNDERRRKPPA